MASQVDKVVKVFKTVAQYPTPSSARVLKFPQGVNTTTILTSWTQRNLERGKTIKFQQTHLIDTSISKASDMLPVDITFELLSCISKSEELRGVVREIVIDTNTKKQYIEVWKQSQLSKNFDLSALEVHGDVYADADFGAFEWSPCEEKLLYIAEKKLPKTEPFYKPRPQESKENGIGDVKATRGEEYLFRPDWGEQLVGKCQPMVCVCDLKTDSLTVLDGIPAHFSPGQVVWTPDGEGIVGVVWNNEPRKLGLIYCSNRRSHIFHLTKDGIFRLLSEEGCAVRSPRFSPDGESLVWLERPADGPHHAAHKLVLYKWNSGEKEVLINIVHQHVPTLGGQPFYGLYNLALPKRCWDEESRRIVFSTPQRSTVNSYVVDIETKSLLELECPEGSQVVLDVCNDMVVCARSSFKQPSRVFLGKLPSRGREKEMVWTMVTNWQTTPALESLSIHAMTLTQDKDPSALCKTFCALYVGPESAQDREVPLIVFPHGGPHSTFTNSFSMEVALFGLLGFGVLMVNYRGSVGSGQDSIDFLLGNIGDTDVKDMKLATTEALNQFSFLNPGKVVLFGGSHGGFLVTHLSGQYPVDYKAVVARNPVIDVASMFSVTDIPDWTAVEAGYLYNPTEEMSAEAFEKMRKCSPINYIQHVVAPTLLLIGKKDARVPSTQGIHYYHNLRARNIKTRLLLYDDNHPLSQIPVEMDNLINSVLWFYQHID
ncbi:acylamino-acid-releasing enzyme [Anabrus simplex]|uniref:acylamino-acid-releasing enzyme n=1 Tax=Anabrus simplex TaxID=316456 RepID=UPI0034DD027A